MKFLKNKKFLLSISLSVLTIIIISSLSLSTLNTPITADIQGYWNAEWYANSGIFKDEVLIKQAGNEIIAEYSKIPTYPNCDGSPITPNSQYFEGEIISNSKIRGISWVCENNIKVNIPLTLEISGDGKRLEGVWQKSSVINKFIFTKISPIGNETR